MSALLLCYSSLQFKDDCHIERCGTEARPSLEAVCRATWLDWAAMLEQMLPAYGRLCCPLVQRSRPGAVAQGSHSQEEAPAQNRAARIQDVQGAQAGAALPGGSAATSLPGAWGLTTLLTRCGEAVASCTSLHQSVLAVLRQLRLIMCVHDV